MDQTLRLAIHGLPHKHLQEARQPLSLQSCGQGGVDAHCLPLHKGQVLRSTSRSLTLVRPLWRAPDTVDAAAVHVQGCICTLPQCNARWQGKHVSTAHLTFNRQHVAVHMETLGVVSYLVLPVFKKGVGPIIPNCKGLTASITGTMLTIMQLRRNTCKTHIECLRANHKTFNFIGL